LKGKVYLVGAGPGDPELLTVKALRLLRSADVVLHDALASPEILALVSSSAKLVDVGKRCGAKAITQKEINRLILDFAQSGLTVVRLKSGDSLIFGRAAEEMEPLHSAAIEFEVVPGITAALGAAAAARIPLFDQRTASKVVFVTAHHAANKPCPDWCSLASSDTTFVVYMPGENYADLARQLMNAGFAADTPCVAISNATKTQQQLYRATIAQLPQTPVLIAPALLIVGEVVRRAATPELALDEVSATFDIRTLEKARSSQELLLAPET
jgi:uroporphyrin-III C-methyltransferase